MPRKESKKRHTTTPRKAAPKAKTTVSKKKPTVSAAKPIAVHNETPAVVIDRDAMNRQIESLRRVDAETACEAATSLGGYPDTAAVDALIAVLSNNDGFYHSVVRSAAAASLGKIGNDRAVPALINAIRDPMAEASAEAVRALAQIGNDRAVPALIQVVRNVDGFFLPVVRLAAVSALATFADDEAANELSRVSTDVYEDPVIRQAAGGR